MKTFRLSFLALLACAASIHAAELQVETLPLKTLSTGWGKPMPNKSIGGAPLRVGGKAFARGIGTHAPSVLLLSLDGKATRFTAKVGVDDESAAGPASVEFKLIGDGRELWASGILKPGKEATACDVALTGVRSLMLSVTNGGDSNDSDHADWLEPVITYGGSVPTEWTPPAPPDPPHSPPNAGLARAAGSGTLTYAGSPVLTLPQGTTVGLSEQAGPHGGITQTLRIRFSGESRLRVSAGAEAIAAETYGPAQKKFPLIRTSHGASENLRNNAVYDRTADWMLEFPAGTAVSPSRASADGREFAVTAPGAEVTVNFRPRFYQKHRNLAYYRPWTYRVRRDSITGWSSWWAYMRNCRQSHIDDTLKVWQEKRFADFGYRYIQLDDVYQGRHDDARGHAPNSSGYIGGLPDTWLDWRLDRFPGGLEGYCDSVRKAGFLPALWMGCFFSDTATAQAHPDWFVTGADGKPFPAAWASYGVDTTRPEAVEALIRPTFRGLRAAGMDYVKIDQLRHMLYDNFHRNPQWFAARGITPAELFRNYLRIAREELGKDTFILSCWGVLPESIGLADACRIGGDGYGPVTLQQYNSFNGLVWINDPDHCDVLPKKAAAEAGNVRSTKDIAAVPNDTLIRPALASIAGSMLMLSDSPQVYQDDRNLRGLRASSPVVWSVPGQLYDFDPQKTNTLQEMERGSIQSGSAPSPIDADQFGDVCPYWLNEFDTGFDHWNVLHRLNWTKNPTSAAKVAFADIGLDPAKTYLVHEFWSGKTLGAVKGSFDLAAIDPMGLQSFAIREALDRPQLVSTNRHLSQGAAEIEMLAWNPAANTLEGRSRVIANDDYRILVRVPAGYRPAEATVDRKPVQTTVSGDVLTLPIRRADTASTAWAIRFDKSR